MTDREWDVCRGACRELKPVAMRFHEDLDTGERSEEGLPYCIDCGRHRMGVEIFPEELADIPVYFQDADGNLRYEGTMGDDNP